MLTAVAGDSCYCHGAFGPPSLTVGQLKVLQTKHQELEAKCESDLESESETVNSMLLKSLKMKTDLKNATARLDQCVDEAFAKDMNIKLLKEEMDELLSSKNGLLKAQEQCKADLQLARSNSAATVKPSQPRMCRAAQC